MGYVLYNLFFRTNSFSQGEGQAEVELNLDYIYNFLGQTIAQSDTSFYSLILLLILVGLNWAGETFKWKLLVSQIQPTTWSLAWKSILSGVAMSNITPYRIGGYVARVALLPHENRIKAVSNILLGDFSQLLIGIIAGCIATLLLIVNLPSDNAMIWTLQWSSWVLLVNAVNGIILFIALKKLANRLSKVRFLKRWKGTFEAVQKTAHVKNAIILLVLSSFRFFVIIIQYYLAYKLFGWDVSFGTSLLIVASLLMIYNFLPTFNMFEFGMTKTAILLFLLETIYGKSYITFDLALLVSCSSFLIWLINLALPAFIGSIFVFNMNLFRTKKT